MKRLIAVMLAVVMLASVAVFSSSAADGVYVHTTFGSMEEFMKYFVPGAFFIPDGENQVFGYSEAKALNSCYKEDELGIFLPGPTVWTTFDAQVDIAMASDTDSGARSLQFWYCNDNLVYQGYTEGRQYIIIIYHIEGDEAGYFTIGTHNPFTDEDQILAKSAKTYDLDCDSGNTSYKIGFSVGPNRIRAFLGNECVCEYNDVNDGFCIAQSTPSAFVMWNDGNMVVISEFTAASYGYLYPISAPQTDPVPTQPTEPVTSVSSSVSEVVVTVTNEKGEVETDEKGEVKTEVSEVIVTEIVTVAPADTQNNNGNGGNSTTTGDSAFIVLAAMVAALGCALVVKKVTVK